MIVTRLYEPAIAQASYLIGCAEAGEALIIDPNRDIDRYLEAAAREGLRITHVTETHIHADFVSGSRELAARTGATLHLSDQGDADWKYLYGVPDNGAERPVRLLRADDRIVVGRIHVDAVHTPGHTPEHLAFLITDTAAADAPMAAATGDFIFVGDVGRPDLLERAALIRGTMQRSARTLWASLRAFDRDEPDWLQIWPGHGAGSACGKGISAVPYSTLGYERRFNWAFRAKNEETFVEQVLAGQPDPPTYFARMKQINKSGPPLLGGFRSPPLLDDARLPELVRAGAMVVDAGSAAGFATAHLTGTLNIPFNSSFVTWAGWLLSHTDDLYFILDDHSDTQRIELVRRLALIGLDRVAGVLDRRSVSQALAHGATRGAIQQTTPAELSPRLQAGEVTVLDVRHTGEWQHGHLPGAVHIPLGHLADRLSEVPADRPVVVHCQGGGRSSIAASLLERLGRPGPINLAGGLTAWKDAGLPLAMDAGS